EHSTLSLPDALPIFCHRCRARAVSTKSLRFCVRAWVGRGKPCAAGRKLCENEALTRPATAIATDQIMKILAIDTATERCSVALCVGARWIERAVDTARGHAEIVLPMVEQVLEEAGVRLAELAGIAYGRGPGAFTGVRIAIGVVQGLAYGADLPTVGISNLAAVAQQVAAPGARILVCMDARMSEVY